MPDPSAPITYGAIGALATLTVTAVGGLWAIARKAWPAWTRVDQFLSDWAGAPARPGFAAVPGVPERLAAVEQAVADQGATIASIAALQTQRAAAEQQMADEIERLRRKVDGGSSP